VVFSVRTVPVGVYPCLCVQERYLYRATSSKCSKFAGDVTRHCVSHFRHDFGIFHHRMVVVRHIDSLLVARISKNAEREECAIAWKKRQAFHLYQHIFVIYRNFSSILRSLIRGQLFSNA